MTGTLQNIPQQQQAVDYKIILFKFYRYWYFFAVTIFVALVVAFIFNKYTRPVYEVKTTVLIKDKSENKLNPQDLLGMGLFNNMQNLQNEIGILSSYSLTYRTVTKIGFEVSYFTEENFITRELYHDSPFRVIMDTGFAQPVNMFFKLRFLSKDQYRLESNDEAVRFFDFSARTMDEDRKENVVTDQVFRTGQEVATKQYRFRVVTTDRFDPEEDVKKPFSFSFKSYDALVKEFRNFNIEPIYK